MPPSPTDLRDELDAILSTHGRTTGQCKYVRVVPVEFRVLISEQVAAKKNAWFAFAKLCQNHGYDLIPETIANHYKRGHADDR